MKTTRWYERRLAAYCEEHYGILEDQLEWFPNPSKNKWMFSVPQDNVKRGLAVRVVLSCDDFGNVTEELWHTQDGVRKYDYK